MMDKEIKVKKGNKGLVALSVNPEGEIYRKQALMFTIEVFRRVD